MPKPGTFLICACFILGEKGDSHVSGPISAYSLGPVKEVWEQVGWLPAKRAEQSRIRTPMGLAKENQGKENKPLQSSGLAPKGTASLELESK